MSAENKDKVLEETIESLVIACYNCKKVNGCLFKPLKDKIEMCKRCRNVAKEGQCILAIGDGEKFPMALLVEVFNRVSRMELEMLAEKQYWMN